MRELIFNFYFYYDELESKMVERVGILEKGRGWSYGKYAFLEGKMFYEMLNSNLPLCEKLVYDACLIKEYQMLLENNGFDVSFTIDDVEINSKAYDDIVRGIIDVFDITEEELKGKSLQYTFDKRLRYYSSILKRGVMSVDELRNADRDRDTKREEQLNELRSEGLISSWYGDFEDTNIDYTTGYPYGYDRDRAYKRDCEEFRKFFRNLQRDNEFKKVKR